MKVKAFKVQLISQIKFKLNIEYRDFKKKLN